MKLPDWWPWRKHPSDIPDEQADAEWLAKLADTPEVPEPPVEPQPEPIPITPPAPAAPPEAPAPPPAAAIPPPAATEAPGATQGPQEPPQSSKLTRPQNRQRRRPD